MKRDQGAYAPYSVQILFDLRRTRVINLAKREFERVILSVLIPLF